VAVLGSGLDVAYPAAHRSLFEDIVDRGGSLVTEYAPGARAAPYHFPARNRVIGALSRAVIVVEGAEGSGTLITAEHALELGRAVFAVPGPVTSPLTWVPHQLIRDGATLIRNAGEVLEELGIQAEPGRLPVARLSPEEQLVFDAVHGPVLPEDVASDVARPAAQVVGVLMQLEIRGLVRSVGGRYERAVAAE
jgi:DNA processing protein